jgi:hypothetical protein
MANATTPASTGSPAIVGSWIARFNETINGQVLSTKLVITFLNNGTYLLANRELQPSGSVFNGKIGLEFASYSWDATTGRLTSTTLSTSGNNVGIPKDAPTTITFRADGKMHMVTGTDTQGITFEPVVARPGSVVGSWYSNDRSGGSDDVVLTFLDDLTLVVTDNGTKARDPNGMSGVEYGTYTWDAATGAASYSIRYDTDGQWGLSHGGPRKLVVSGDQLQTFNLDGSTGNAGPAFIRVSNLPANSGNTTGTAGADTLTGGTGTTTLDGGAGTDTAVYTGARASYTLARTDAGFTLKHAAGTDTLLNVERIKFADAHVALDTAGNGGMAYRLYQAAFNRTPDQGGLGFQMKALDDGANIAQVAANFIASPEFTATYGALDNTAFVNQLYQNVLHRAADASGLAFHTHNLATGANTRANVLVGFSESPENQAALIGTIQNGMVYTL